MKTDTALETELGSASKDAKISHSSFEYASVPRVAMSASVIRLVRMGYKYAFRSTSGPENEWKASPSS